MSFASSAVGVIGFAIFLGLLTNVLYVLFGLEQAAIWLRNSVHWVCAGLCNFCYIMLWESLLARVKQAVRPVEKRKVIEEQYLTCTTIIPARGDGIEGEIDCSNPSGDGEAVTITRRTIGVIIRRTIGGILRRVFVANTRQLWPSPGGWAYLQLKFPYKDRIRLKDADAWVWVSPELAQRVEKVQPGLVKKAIYSWQGALENDAATTLQIDSWGVLSGKPGAPIQLWRIEEDNVPVITSACGSRIEGHNLQAARIQVSTQDSSELLCICSVQDKSATGGLDVLFAQIPSHYNKQSGAFILAYNTDVTDGQELEYRSKATQFVATSWCARLGFLPWMLSPCTWILLTAFVATAIYLIVHLKAHCTSERRPGVGRPMITIAVQGFSPPMHDPVPAFLYKAGTLLVAVCFLAAIARSRIHHRLSFRLSTSTFVYDQVFGEVEDEKTVCRVSEQQGEVSVLFCRQDKQLSISNFRGRLRSWSESSSRRVPFAQSIIRSQSFS